MKLLPGTRVTLTILCLGLAAVVVGQKTKNTAIVPEDEATTIGFRCPDREPGQPRPDVTSRLGDITKKAVKLPRPRYRHTEKAAVASGIVRAEVVVNINTGEVVWGRVANGHPLLREAVKDVVCLARFSPTYDADGRASGLLTYRFARPK